MLKLQSLVLKSLEYELMRKFENITDISEETNFESLEEFVKYSRGVQSDLGSVFPP